MVAVVQKALEDPNAEVGEAAIVLLDGYKDPAILPAVEQALKNKNEEIRRAAVDLLAEVDTPDAPQVGDLLAQALLDTSEDIRDATLGIIAEQSEEVQLRILQDAIASPYDEVKDTAVSMLQDIGNKQAVDILINGIMDKNPDFRETVTDTLESLIDQKFDTFEQAQSWWNANHSKYEEDLTPIETEPTNPEPTKP
jgi:HEAT repeat protein